MVPEKVERWIFSVTRGLQQRLGFNIRRSVENSIRLGSWEDVIFADNLSHTELKFFFFTIGVLGIQGDTYFGAL